MFIVKEDLTLVYVEEKFKNQNTCLKSFDSTVSDETLWRALFEFSKLMQCDAMCYHHLPPPGAVDFDNNPSVSFGFDAPVGGILERSQKTLKSPLQRRTLQPHKPIFWTKAKEALGISDTEWTALQAFYCSHHSNGVIIPVHGPNGRNGCAVYRFADPLRRFKKSEIRRLQWASQSAHQKFCEVRPKRPSQLVKLTGREKEVLTWVARGKSNSVIADIVGISQHTVNGYLRRIYLKTQTSDRTTASVRGIAEVLIDF